MSAIHPGDVVETTHYDHGVPRVERWTALAVHTVTDGPRAGVWVSPWTAEGAERAGWHHLPGSIPRVQGMLHHGGMSVGWIADMPHGGIWTHADDVTVVVPAQGSLLDLLEDAP